MHLLKDAVRLRISLELERERVSDVESKELCFVEWSTGLENQKL
jgi:hypothetical protein